MKEEIEAYLKAGYPALFVVTPEEIRVEAILKAIGKARNWPAHQWNPVAGLTEMNTGNQEAIEDPVELMQQIRQMVPGEDQHIVIAIEDFQLFLQSPDPLIVAELKATLRHCKAKGIHLVFIGARRIEVPELEREIAMLEFKLPDREEMGGLLENIATSFGAELNGDRDPILSALSGLTIAEAENALALSWVRTKRFDPGDLAKEKASQVKKSGLLEIVDSSVTLDDIGGLELFKRWIMQRRLGFGQEARDYGMPNPKGVLTLGLPGTAKSMGAKACGSAFGLPILRLDMGSIFGSLVGESEANIRLTIQTAEAMAPCILWCDEIDKGIGGSSGGTQDGGTSDRVLGTLLNWMQEKTSAVFVYATANDPARLAASDGALVRKGRFDELFFFDLPTVAERSAIWEIKLRAAGLSTDLLSYDLIEATDQFTGAEIESVVLEARWSAFDDGMRTPTTEDLRSAISTTVPLAKTMGEAIDRTRKWAATRCRPASEAAPIGEIQSTNNLKPGDRRVVTD